MGQHLLLDAGVHQAVDQLVHDHLVAVVGGAGRQGEVAHLALALQPGEELLDGLLLLLPHGQEVHHVHQHILFPDGHLLDYQKKGVDIRCCSCSFAPENAPFQGAGAGCPQLIHDLNI